MEHKRNQDGFHYIAVLLVIVLGVIGLAGWRIYAGNSRTFLSKTTHSVSEAKKQGKIYSNNTCNGTDIKKLDHLPIDTQNITRVLPYGGTVGAHVMPISHGYIWPGEFNSARDSFNVYAMADST